MRRVVIALAVVGMFVLVACFQRLRQGPDDHRPEHPALGAVPDCRARTRRPRRRCTTPSRRSSTTSRRTTCSRTSSPRSSGSTPTGRRRPRAVPFPGVTHPPRPLQHPPRLRQHRQGGIQTAGWILAEDRGLLLQQARYNSRVAVIDAPGLSAIDLTANLQTFKPSAQTEAFAATETKALKREGKEGKAVLRDIDTYISGINAYLAFSHSSNAPWTRNDVYAVNALKGQFLGQGGGDEAPSRCSSTGSSSSSAAGAASRPSTTCASSRTREASPPSTGTFPYGHIPRKHPGSVVIDHNSFTPDARRRRRSIARRSASRAGPGEQRADGHREPLHNRPPDPGRRAADLPLLPGAGARDRHARPALQLARRHLRPVPRLPADRPHARASRPRSPRRAATSSTSTRRRSAAAATRGTSTRASAGRWATSTRGR